MDNIYVDWSRLESIADPNDPSDQEWLKDMITNLYENMETRIQNIISFLNTHNLESLRLELHQIKGVAANFGLKELFQLTKEAEQSIKDGKPENGIELAKKVESTWKETKKFLQEKYS